MLNFDQAIAELLQLKTSGKKVTVQQLMEIAAQVSVEPALGNTQGSVTLLYSGEINGTKSEKYIGQMIDQGADIRVIDKTNVGKFLASAEFNKAWFSAEGTASAPYNGTSGPWAQASGRFVADTVGEVRVPGLLPSAESVFVKTELNDQLYGGEGDDRLYRGGGTDQMLGGAGNDSLNAGEGDDLMDEGGYDIFQMGWRVTDTVLGRGSLLLTNKATGAKVHIEGFDVDDPNAVSPIEKFELQGENDQPLMLSAAQLIARLAMPTSPFHAPRRPKSARKAHGICDFTTRTSQSSRVFSGVLSHTNGVNTAQRKLV